MTHRDSNRLAAAESLLRRAVEILLKTTHSTGRPPPHSEGLLGNYFGLREDMGRSREEIGAALRKMAPELFGDRGRYGAEQPGARRSTEPLRPVGKEGRIMSLLSRLFDGRPKHFQPSHTCARCGLLFAFHSLGDFPQPPEPEWERRPRFHCPKCQKEFCDDCARLLARVCSCRTDLVGERGLYRVVSSHPAESRQVSEAVRIIRQHHTTDATLGNCPHCNTAFTLAGIERGFISEQSALIVVTARFTCPSCGREVALVVSESGALGVS